eukprot:TRINITY_DN668_c0_g1_i1.p1 TRINITY_DN668_c0_g1~~TRINITY_DN668_c0_g1_i1.p1  ORF type:complete len:535 (-),score=102.85 TRINITY_DN668_c0_g1_i1:78-1682(-)
MGTRSGMLIRAARRCARRPLVATCGFRRALSVQPVAQHDGAGGEAVDEEEVEVVSYARSKAHRTVDKSKLDFDRVKRFDMSRPWPGIPPLKPSNELPRPETIVSTLSSGLRVASQETYGQLCTFGVLVNAGSRHETEENQGVSHLLELMAFKSTPRRAQQQVVSELEAMGATVTAHSSREQMLFCVDVLRDYLEPAMDLLSDVVLTPEMTEEEVEDQKVVMQYQMEDMLPDTVMKEALQGAAYPGQALGRPHWCPPESMDALSADMARQFRTEHYTAPNMVLVGAGVQHDELMRLGDKYFALLASTAGAPIITSPASQYVGGEVRVEGVVGAQKEDWTRVCVAFEVGGWDHPQFVPTCVLQVLLGGGDSFSAGGPGKGMYSRLYREVLNRHFWVESAEAFTSMHSESGLLGIAGAAAPPDAGKLMHVFSNHFSKLALQPVDPVELSRAKNMLKCNVLTHLESRLVLFEDIGRQILSYGYRETPEAICEKIDRVTADDIQQIARDALSKPPSIACIGADISSVPDYGQVVHWFQS